METGEIETDPREVNDWKSISLKELKGLLDAGKIQFTSWGLDEINFILKHRNVLAGLKR